MAFGQEGAFVDGPVLPNHIPRCRRPPFCTVALHRFTQNLIHTKN